MVQQESIENRSIDFHRKVAVAALFAIAVWSVAGFVDRSGRGWFDPLFQTDYKILHAPQGGTLATAGFMQGDSVLSVEGIPVVDLGMYSRWPRSLSRRPGDSLTLVVQRDSQQIAGEIIARESSSSSNMIVGGLLIVLAFLGSGLWALFSTQSVHAVRLSYIGLTCGASMPGPYLGGWDGVATHFQIAMLVLWTVLLLRFFLEFPKPKRFGENKIAISLIYAPWFALLGCLAIELIYHPRFYHTFGPLYALLMLGYSALAVAALSHTIAKTSRGGLRSSGMAVILTGVSVALAALLIAAVDWFFLWNFEIPGSGWLTLTLGVIPLSMAAAVRKHALAHGEVPSTFA